MRTLLSFLKRQQADPGFVGCNCCQAKKICYLRVCTPVNIFIGFSAFCVNVDTFPNIAEKNATNLSKMARNMFPHRIITEKYIKNASAIFFTGNIVPGNFRNISRIFSPKVHNKINKFIYLNM